MSPHADTLFCFRANQSLFFLLSAGCSAEKQQIPILSSLVLPANRYTTGTVKWLLRYPSILTELATK